MEDSYEEPKIQLLIEIKKEHYDIIAARLNEIRAEVKKKGYADNDIVYLGWEEIADGKPYSEPEDGMRLIDANTLKDRCIKESECLQYQAYITLGTMIAEIDSAKTIARPQAEWVCKTKSTFPQYQPDEFECSSCKQVSTQKYNFCPYCGADMRGNKND